MPSTSQEEHLKFLVSCVRHSNQGRVDFAKVALETNVITKGAAVAPWERASKRAASAKRYERLVRAYGPDSTTSAATTIPKSTSLSTSARAPKNASRNTSSTNVSSLNLAATYSGPSTKAKKRKQDAYADEEDAAADDDEEYVTQSFQQTGPAVRQEFAPNTSSTQQNLRPNTGNDTAEAFNHNSKHDGKLMEKNMSMARYLNERKATPREYYHAGEIGMSDSRHGSTIGPSTSSSYYPSGLQHGGHDNMAYRYAAMPHGSYRGSSGQNQYHQPPPALSAHAEPYKSYDNTKDGEQHPQLTYAVSKKQKTQHDDTGRGGNVDVA